MNSMWALFPPAALCLRPPVVSSLGDAATHPALFTDCREIYSSTRFAQTICLSFLDIVYFQPTTQACMRGACGPNDSHFFLHGRVLSIRAMCAICAVCGCVHQYLFFTQQPPLPTTHIQAGQKIHCLLTSVSNNYEGEEILVDCPQWARHNIASN